MSGGAEIYIEVAPGETRAGHLDSDGKPMAIEIDRATRARLTGAVYLARVRSVDKRLGAAFLDLGEGGQGFLTKAKGVEEGQAIVVQIARDAQDDKGPAATRQIVLWGRYVALQPGRGGGLQTARALGQGKRRAQAVAEAEAALSDPTDLLLRGPAGDVDGSVLVAEAERLRADWAKIEAGKGGKAPATLLPPPDFIEMTLREADSEARVALDDRIAHKQAADLCAARYPDLVDGLAFHNVPAPLFDVSGFADCLEDALSREITLQGGGRITIEETRALTAIDVDIGGGEAGASGKDEALHRLNRRAAEEIARQILLRRLSGLIAIDFAGITQRGKMKALIDILRARLKGGEGHADVLGVTAAGLIEITRQRTGPTLSELCLAPLRSSVPAPDAEAAETLRRALRLTGAGRPTVTLSEAAIAQLSGPMAQARAETERRLGQALVLVPGRAGPDLRMER